MPDQRTVMITGCSDGGLGASLALAFHALGLKVYATSRNPSQLNQVSAAGIETLNLDVLFPELIRAAVSKLPHLDILVNNAGAEYLMPVSDIDINDAKKLFDLNVWSYIEVTQACLPLLLKSTYSVYTASKAAIAMFSDTLRLELSVFGMNVVDLKTGVVRSNLIDNHKKNKAPQLPESSIYQPAREAVEKALSPTGYGAGMPTLEWGKAVAKDLLKKNPSKVIWKGEQIWVAWLISISSHGFFDGMLKMTGLNVVEKIMKA